LQPSQGLPPQNKDAKNISTYFAGGAGNMKKDVGMNNK
jgi:hypothetical protein